MTQKCSRERQRTAAGGASRNEKCVDGENKRCEWSQILDRREEAHREATRMEYVSGLALIETWSSLSINSVDVLHLHFCLSARKGVGRRDGDIVSTEAHALIMALSKLVVVKAVFLGCEGDLLFRCGTVELDARRVRVARELQLLLGVEGLGGLIIEESERTSGLQFV